MKIDISNIILKTDRLILRIFNYNDLYDLYEYASIDGVGEMAGWKHHKSIEESNEILKLFIKNKHTFAIIYQDKVIGSIGIDNYKENNNYKQLGFVLSKKYWGLGLMPEALKSIINYLFSETNLDRIYCSHFKTNIQSAKVQNKLGFKFNKEYIIKTKMETYENSIENVIYKKIEE